MLNPPPLFLHRCLTFSPPSRLGSVNSLFFHHENFPSLWLASTHHEFYLRRERGDTLLQSHIFPATVLFLLFPLKPLFILAPHKLFPHCLLKPLIRILTPHGTKGVLAKTTVTFLCETQGSSLNPHVICPDKETRLLLPVHNKTHTLQPFRTLLSFYFVYLLILLMSCLFCKVPDVECFVLYHIPST